MEENMMNNEVAEVEATNAETEGSSAIGYVVIAGITLIGVGAGYLLHKPVKALFGKVKDKIASKKANKNIIDEDDND